MNFTHIIIGAALFAAQSFAAVYSQPSLWTGVGTDVGSSWTSDSTGSGATLSGFRTYENFSLAAPATINQASWVGIFLNASDLSNAAPNSTGWVIRLSPDGGGGPTGPNVFNITLTTADVSMQTLGTGLFGGKTVTVYGFTANLPTTSLAANTQYWFSPLSTSADFNQIFSWVQGTGGNGQSFQVLFQNGVNTDTFVRDGDRAFSLSNVTVPEPSSASLIGGAGLLLLCAVRRRSADSSGHPGK